MFESAYQNTLSRLEFLTFNAKVYHFNFGWTDVPDGSEQIVGIKTPAEVVAVHMYNLAAKTTGASSRLQLYEDAIISGATEVNGLPMNRSSGYDFAGTMTRGGTVDSYGTPLFQPNAKTITGGQGAQNKQVFWYSRNSYFDLYEKGYAISSFFSEHKQCPNRHHGA